MKRVYIQPLVEAFDLPSITSILYQFSAEGSVDEIIVEPGQDADPDPSELWQ